MQKDILAKLLATENITVVHENAPTASFNVKDRVLTLPLWEDLTDDNYDHFIGHEVGHALYTPEDGWHDAVCERGSAYKSFLNVIEDARIERLIQRKYPGLRRNFINSYKKLMADGFFGADLEEINTFDLIDRINTYFKLGASCGVRIEKDEMCWIKEIDECVTWEQVVDIADRLFAEEKAKKEELAEKLAESLAEMGVDPGEEDSEYGEGYDYSESDAEEETDEQGQNGQASDEEESGSEGTENAGVSDEGGEEQEDLQSEESESFDDVDAGYGGDTDPRSRTEESLHSNIRKEFNNSEDKKAYNCILNTNDPTPLIISYKNVIAFSDGEQYQTFNRCGGNLWKKFQTENRKTVNYMVKEFEMKKKASEYARTSLAKTGVIDPVKMNNYKFSEDIFRKVAVTPEGKNHGLVMYLDWSGSMVKHIKSTIDQVLNLVMFCRQVNIPYRVYAFSDRFDQDANNPVKLVNDETHMKLGYKSGFRLLEFFNNKMNRADFTRSASMLLAIGQYYDTNTYYAMPYQFVLGGTPLDDTIMASIQIHHKFKKENRLDIVNTVFLTDGDSHSIEVFVKGGNESYSWSGYKGLWSVTGHNKVTKLIDPVTKKSYRVSNKRNDATTQLLKLFRDNTGSNAIGYRVVSMNRRSLYNDLRSYATEYQVAEMQEDLKKNKFTVIPNAGYSKFFAVVGGKTLEVANTTIDVADDASTAKIRSAFRKANGNRKNSRLLLRQFIDMVA
jgi:hypothetical protein